MNKTTTTEPTMYKTDFPNLFLVGLFSSAFKIEAIVDSSNPCSRNCSSCCLLSSCAILSFPCDYFLSIKQKSFLFVNSQSNVIIHYNLSIQHHIFTLITLIFSQNGLFLNHNVQFLNFPAFDYELFFNKLQKVHVVWKVRVIKLN